MAELSKKQIEKMKATIEAFEKSEAEAAIAAQWDYISPLLGVINSPEYETVLVGLTELADSYADNPSLIPHISALVTILGNLRIEGQRLTPETLGA